MSLWETYRPKQAFCQKNNTVEENLHRVSSSPSLLAQSEMTQGLLSGPGLTASLWVAARLLVPLALSTRLMEQISVRFPHLLNVQKCQREAALHPQLTQGQDSVAQGCRPSRLPESSNSLSGERCREKRGSGIDSKARCEGINPSGISPAFISRLAVHPKKLTKLKHVIDAMAAQLTEN